MKKNYLIAIALFFCQLAISQDFFVPTDYRGAFAPSPTIPWTDSWINWNPEETVYPSSDVTITENIIANTTWTSDKVYLISGQIYVKNNAILTIEAGTIVLVEKTGNNDGYGLIVTKGSKLNAIGTALNPIVFTSDQPLGSRESGDWGGIVLLGKASTNAAGGFANIEGITATPDTQYGGGTSPVNADNSGTLSYVRIEFAGQALQPDKEINGLTMGAVGSGTTIDHIQTSFVGDDGFEWFGGSVNCKYLVSFRNSDDDFDTDNGYSGKVQFGLAVRDPLLFDAQVGKGTTSGFESDNDSGGTTASPQTSASFANITLIGPKRGELSPSLNSSWRNGAHIRRNTGLKIYNSLFLDFITGVHIDGLKCEENAVNGILKFKSNVVAGSDGKVCATTLVGTSPNQTPSAFTTIRTWFKETNKNDSVASTAGILVAPYSYTSPDYRPAPNSIALSNINYDLAAGIEEVSLFGNIILYPNPAQNEATLVLSLLKSSVVNVAVYDVTGKIVSNVFNGNLKEGETNLFINTTDFSNGMYYAKISTDSDVETIKLSISK
jgi:hypothetical protein